MMLVFRVEDKNGFGPYRRNQHKHAVELCYLHNADADRPAPEYDELCVWSWELDNYKYGFRDLQSLRNWFSNAKHLLEGLKIGVYRSSRVIIGRRQIAYKGSEYVTDLTLSEVLQ